MVELEQLLTIGFSTTNFEEGGEQSASAKRQPSSGTTALSSEGTHLPIKTGLIPFLNLS
ncbi:MAG UNVERIFIED_CONTAM: hypothetical protein LVR29_06320 [Microcystis novacekii LVE1205-3]